MPINFKVTPADSDTIQQIVERAEVIASYLGTDINRLHLTMDLTATHANGNPLRLTDLLAADQFDFVHDVWGIMRHIDRVTGKLTDCFSPRFSARQECEA